MNTMLKTLQICAEATETLCPTHHLPLMEIAGHRLCKLCAKEKSITHMQPMRMNCNSDCYNRKLKFRAQ